MIVYFDSSSIVKWFFDEPNAELARNIKDNAKIAFTSRLSFPEVMSAMYRAVREGRCDGSDLELIRDEFVRIWPGFQQVFVNERPIQDAGQLVFRHSLRAYDAVHLASALVLKEEAEQIELFFSCFDRHLNRAAQQEGLLVHQEIL